LILALLLSIFSTTTSAAEKLSTATKTALFNVGSSSEISFRFHRSESTEWVTNFRFRARQSTIKQREPNGDTSGGQCFRTSENTSANLGIFGGLRFNTPSKTLTWFSQPEIGLIADSRSFNSKYSGSCIFSTTDRPDDPISYGLAARLRAGAIYFITPEISLEGSAGFAGEYLAWNTNSDYEREDWHISAFASLKVGYHW